LANVQFAKRYSDDGAERRAQSLTPALRLILVGTAEERTALRARLSESAVVAGEFSTLSAANASALSADAIVMARPQSRMPDDFVEHLTPREIEVLELLAEGLPNKAIALRLRISDQTVKFHVASICGKLSAANRTDAVRRAIRRGLITV
jgi:DNA-binding NarL/FixJ family response regulator